MRSEGKRLIMDSYQPLNSEEGNFRLLYVPDEEASIARDDRSIITMSDESYSYNMSIKR